MFYILMVSVFRYQMRVKAQKEWGCSYILAYSSAESVTFVLPQGTSLEFSCILGMQFCR